MTIGVYGLGRFGMFWAHLLSDRFTVLGYSRTPRKDIPGGITIVTEDELLECDTIFFCVSISSFKDVLKRVSSRLKPGTLVCDTCSVKSVPIGWMVECLPSEVDIIGTHPMFGPDSGAHGVDGFPIVVCPVRVSDTRVQFWIDSFKGYQLDVLEMSADQHDHQVAFTQGVTHFIGRVLDEMDLHLHPLSTLGFRKILDVMEQTCNDPWQLFLDLQRMNPYTGEMREKLNQSFIKIMKLADEQTVSDTGADKEQG